MIVHTVAELKHKIIFNILAIRFSKLCDFVYSLN
jgi:hypothetical protein